MTNTVVEQIMFLTHKKQKVQDDIDEERLKPLEEADPLPIFLFQTYPVKIRNSILKKKSNEIIQKSDMFKDQNKNLKVSINLASLQQAPTPATMCYGDDIKLPSINLLANMSNTLSSSSSVEENTSSFYKLHLMQNWI